MDKQNVISGETIERHKNEMPEVAATVLTTSPFYI